MSSLTPAQQHLPCIHGLPYLPSQLYSTPPLATILYQVPGFASASAFLLQSLIHKLLPTYLALRRVHLMKH